jgi:hypothetical protein
MGLDGGIVGASVPDGPIGLVGDGLLHCESFAAPERFDRHADKSHLECQGGADAPVRSNLAPRRRSGAACRAARHV